MAGESYLTNRLPPCRKTLKRKPAPRCNALSQSARIYSVRDQTRIARREAFQAATIYRRADRAWEALALGRLRLHRARHTYASFMIAAGVNAKALSSFMGHSSIKVTFDLYDTSCRELRRGGGAYRHVSERSVSDGFR